MTHEEYWEHVRQIAWDAANTELTGDRRDRLINDAVDTATAGLGERWNLAMNSAVRMLRLELKEAMKVHPARAGAVHRHGSRLTKLERAVKAGEMTIEEARTRAVSETDRRRSERSEYA